MSLKQKHSFDEWYKKNETRYKDTSKPLLRKMFYLGWGASARWQFGDDVMERQRTEIYQLKEKIKELEEFLLKNMKPELEARKNRVKKIYQHTVKHWTTPDEWFNMMGKILSEE